MNWVRSLLTARRSFSRVGLTVRKACLPTLVCVFSFLLLTLAPKAVMATEAQEHLCNVGFNLGSAYGRLHFFGKAFGGTPPPDQITAISGNLSNASAEIAAFEPSVSRLHRSARRDETVRLIRNSIDALASQADTLTSNDAHRFNTIRGQYREGLSYTYRSDRTSPLEAGGTCDTYLLDTCYHFAAAHIAAAIEPPIRQSIQADSGQSHHVEMMRMAIREGIGISFDNITGTHDPATGTDYPAEGGAQTNPRICCNFGEEASWSPISALTRNDAWAEFTALAPPMLRFIRAIPQCKFGDCKHAIGKWKWGDYGTVVIKADHSTQHMVGNEERNTGTWTCKNGRVQITWSKGGWIDAVFVKNDGAGLEGTNQQGMPISATRIADDHSSSFDCSRVAGSWRWGQYGTVVIRSNNSTQHIMNGKEQNTGTWTCKDGKVRIAWSEGGWVDTLFVKNDGNTLEGNNQKGMPIQASKMK